MYLLLLLDENDVNISEVHEMVRPLVKEFKERSKNKEREHKCLLQTGSIWLNNHQLSQTKYHQSKIKL